MLENIGGLLVAGSLGLTIFSACKVQRYIGCKTWALS
jgi:hypothetical protein